MMFPLSPHACKAAGTSAIAEQLSIADMIPHFGIGYLSNLGIITFVLLLFVSCFGRREFS